MSVFGFSLSREPSGRRGGKDGKLMELPEVELSGIELSMTLPFKLVNSNRRQTTER